MTRKGNFYLGRVHKGGLLNDKQLLQAFESAPSVSRRDYAWTFTGFEADPKGEWYFAQLTKYHPEGVVSVVDHERHAEVERIEEDLIIAKSPFVYLPAFSGVVYLHVWNHIQRETFAKRFSEIVVAKQHGFFVLCEVEAIVDLQSFVKRVANLSRIDKISAKVHLPNPLFGPLWKSLRDYVAKRNADTVKLEELGGRNGLRSELPRLVSTTRNGDDDEDCVAIGDAAILMAADGYGSGRITGVIGRSEQAVVIRTAENQLNFKADRESPAVELAHRAHELLVEHSFERELVHENSEK